MVPCRNSWGKVMEKGKEKAYIKGFLVEALINAMPRKEATAVVDRVLPQYAGSWILPGRRRTNMILRLSRQEFARIIAL